MFAFLGPVSGAKLGAIMAIVTMAVVIPLITIDLVGGDPPPLLSTYDSNNNSQFIIDPNLTASATVSITPRQITSETIMATIIPVPSQIFREPGGEQKLLALVVDQLGIRLEYPEISIRWEFIGETSDTLVAGIATGEALLTFDAVSTGGATRLRVVAEWDSPGGLQTVESFVDILDRDAQFERQIFSVEPLTGDAPLVFTQRQLVRLDAIALDIIGEIIPDAQIDWRLVDQNLGTLIAPGFLSVEGEPGSYTEALEVIATHRGLSVSTMVDATIFALGEQLAEAPRARVVPAQLTIVEGSSIQLNGIVIDQSGEPVGISRSSWSVTDPSAGQISSDGTFTSGHSQGQHPDAVKFTAFLDDGTTATTMVPVNVKAMNSKSILAGIAVNPSTFTLRRGGSTLVRVFGVDSDGTPISVDGSSLVVNDSETGYIAEGGAFIATGVPGKYPNALTASVSSDDSGTNIGFSTQLSISIAGEIEEIIIIPENAVVQAGKSITFRAIALDKNRTAIPSVIWSWRVNDSAAGTISPLGLFSAGSAPGEFENLITVHPVIVPEATLVFPTPTAEVFASLATNAQPDSILTGGATPQVATASPQPTAQTAPTPLSAPIDLASVTADSEPQNTAGRSGGLVGPVGGTSPLPTPTPFSELIPTIGPLPTSTNVLPTLTPVPISTLTPPSVTPTAATPPTSTPRPKAPIPPTAGPRPTSTPTGSTPVPSPTATISPVPTPTETPTPSPTVVPLLTPTPSPTVVPLLTPTPTSTPLPTFTPTPSPTPLPPGFVTGGADDRFGIITSGSQALVADRLNTLNTRWYIDYGMDPMSAPPGSKKVPYIPVILGNRVPEAVLTDIAVKSPGSYWYIGGEPNTRGISGTRFVAEFDYYVGIIKAADPTAKIVSASILNWDFTCTGCSGFPSGHTWLLEFITAYQDVHNGVLPPVDVWAIDAYPLTWNKVPMVDWFLVAQQIQGLRDFLDFELFRFNDPIWITEAGTHWAYGSWELGPGNKIRIPSHLDWVEDYEWDEVAIYTESLIRWLLINGQSMKIEKWFFFRDWIDPATHENADANYSGLYLFESNEVGSPLNQVGQLYYDYAQLNAAAFGGQ